MSAFTPTSSPRLAPGFIQPNSGSKLLTPNTRSLMFCPLNKTPEARFQFNGFKEIRALVTELVQENKKRSIYDDEIEELRNLILSKQISSPKEALMLLKLLSEHFFYGIEDVFHEFIDQLQDCYPQIGRFMTKLLDAPLSGPVLTPDGIQKMLSFYETHCQFPQGILSCEPVSQIPFLVEKMQKNYQENEMRGWAVYADEFEQDKHIVPVFAICRYGKTHVFIFDSQGHTLHPQFTAMSRVFNELQWNRHILNIELYSYKERRQRGSVECSMYAILDLKNLIEMHLGGPEITLVDFYRQNPQFCSKVKQPKSFGIYGPPFYEIHHLIPAMMKPTQSLTQLKKQSAVILEHSPSYPIRRRLFGGDVIQKEQDPVQFPVDMESYELYSRDDVLQNSYIAQHRLEYLVYLLTLILDEVAANTRAASRASPTNPDWAEDYV